MADLPRLLDDPALEGATRAVLASAADDAPSRERKHHVAKALGLTALAAETTGTAAAAAWWAGPTVVLGLIAAGAIGWSIGEATEEPAAVEQSLRVGARQPAPAPAPAPALAAAAETDTETDTDTAAATATATATEAATATATATEAATAAATAAATVPRRRPPRTAIAPPAPDPAPAPAAATEPAVAAPEPAAAVVEPAPAPTPPPVDARRLAAEVALLDTARTALAADDPRAAIAALDRHASEFPDGVLDAEADVLRIDSLLRLGDRAAAEMLGARFLSRHPKSPLAKRVRSLLASPRSSR